MGMDLGCKVRKKNGLGESGKDFLMRILRKATGLKAV
jgi:hypothetical protein